MILSHVIHKPCCFLQQRGAGVINVSTLSKLRRMVHRDHLSVREASRRLGISRNTAAKWLEADEMVEPRYPKRATVPSVLYRRSWQIA